MDSLSSKGFAEDLVPAPKTFFVFPDLTLINGVFLEVAFSRGYECYPIPGIIGADYEQVVEAILYSFQSSILFFFIERDEPIDYFVKLLEGIQNRYGDSVRIGVFYKKRKSREEEKIIQISFLYDVGIEAGCIPLANTALANHELLLGVLAANEVAGRRKAIRMPDHSDFRADFEIADLTAETTILDLSVTHFTVQFDSAPPSWKVGTKLNTIKLKLGDSTLSVRGVVSLKRVVKGNVVFVIRFHSAEGVEERVKSVVNGIIYRYYQKKTMDLISLRLGRVHGGS